MSYLILKDLKINQELINQLCAISWQDLTLALRANSTEARQFFFKNYKLTDYFDFVKYYGLNFNHAATLETYILPQPLEQKIIKEIQNYFHQEFDDLVIRIQVVYDGKVVPMHKDPTRTASVVYPLDHHSYSSTVFYDSVGSTDTVESSFLHLLNPTLFTESSKVSIDQYPVLLDVKQAHQVFLSDAYTKQNPRLSLSIKWTKLEFDQLIDMLNASDKF
jgi:hypothetical protein